MNDQQLDKTLMDLAEDVPPMPENFHQAWMKQVKDEAALKPAKRANWTRILSVAAALVFVVGGTLLTRDELPSLGTPQKMETSYDYGSEEGYSMRAAGASNGLMMAETASMDSMAESPASAREQKIIRSASLTISTATFEESLTALRSLCSEAGGFVAYASESDYDNRRTANLTLRISAEKLDSFLLGAGDQGRITHRSESANDVTDSYYDTKARLDTQLKLMERLQALITDAAELSDLLALESQMAETQYQIDALRADLEHTDDQVNYATVDVKLREELPADSITDANMTLGQRVADAIGTGWKAFVAFLADAAVFVAASLPFIAVVAVVVVVVKVVRKRKK